MVTHSSILAWEIPGSEEPGGLQSIASNYKSEKLASHSSSIQDAEAETPTFGPPDGKSSLTGKDLDAGKD